MKNEEVMTITLNVKFDAKAFGCLIQEIAAEVDRIEAMKESGALQKAPEPEAAPEVNRPRKVKTPPSPAQTAFDEFEEQVDQLAATTTPASPSGDFGDEDVPPAPPVEKTKKAKKIAIEDVQEACKGAVGRMIDRGMAAADSRGVVLALLQKHFSVKSVAHLKATEYALAIEKIEGLE